MKQTPGEENDDETEAEKLLRLANEAYYNGNQELAEELMKKLDNLETENEDDE